MENYNPNYGANYRPGEAPPVYENPSAGERVTVERRKRANTLLILTIVLAIVAIALSAVSLVLLTNKDSQSSKTNNDKATLKSSQSGEEADGTAKKETAQEKKENNQKPAVKTVIKTMYVDCNDSLSLRSGPGTDYSRILAIPAGDTVDLLENAENEFVNVRYNGTEGYVSAAYLSDTRPYVWNYNEAEVEAFVEEVLYAYVDSINTKDVNRLTRYLGGEAIQDANKTHNQVTSSVYREEILGVSCHSVKRISRTQVTVVRESTIRIYRNNGNVDDKYEKYLSTVENTGNGMRVVKFQAL